jgi:hypothetical protein
MSKDFGYFGDGLEGYAHYMQEFERNNAEELSHGADFEDDLLDEEHDDIEDLEWLDDDF